MRYLFRGLIRDTGRPVEGHVEADTEELAFTALADNGIVTESLRPDPKPQASAPEPVRGEFADALESAFDTSSVQVPFDDLSDRYRGKRVWVIDRDKIRRRVAQVVDGAIQQAQLSHGGESIRDTVAKAIEGMFKDNRNLTSPADQVAAANAAKAGGGGGGSGSAALDSQITRIEQLVRQAESVLSQIQSLARSGGFGGGGGPVRRRMVQSKKNEEQNAVLLEIFKSNLDLRRTMEGGAMAPAGASDAPAPAEQPSP